MTELRVSDHALLGFLAEVGGVQIEEIRAQLVASLARAHEAAERMGGGDYLIAAGKRCFIVRNGVVVELLGNLPRSLRYKALKRRPRTPAA